jgi:lipopolysaccharide/colanic/teichoic acid biosynthesis glycosyltransferase
MSASSSAISLAGRGASKYAWKPREIAERVSAGLGLAACAPILAGCAALVTVLSRRAPFVAHRRAGLNGSTLWVLKLRTMWAHDSMGSLRGVVERITDESGPIQKSPVDERVTSRFAAFCRKYSLDELPQLLQVLTGEMSLVGPRPLTSSELAEHYGADAAEVLSVKPGLTGLWQVMGRNSLTYPQRRRLDLFLVRRYSLALYFEILRRTVPAVVTGRHAH